MSHLSHEIIELCTRLNHPLAVGGQTWTGGMVGVLLLEHTDFPQAYRLNQRSYGGGVAGVKRGWGISGGLPGNESP